MLAADEGGASPRSPSSPRRFGGKVLPRPHPAAAAAAAADSEDSGPCGWQSSPAATAAAASPSSPRSPTAAAGPSTPQSRLAEARAPVTPSAAGGGGGFLLPGAPQSLTLRWQQLQQQHGMAGSGLLPPSDPAAAAADAAVARRQYLASLYAQYCAAQQLQHGQQEGAAALGAHGSGSWLLQEGAAGPCPAEVEGEGADVAIAEVDISDFDMDIDCEFNKLLEEPVRLRARPAAECGHSAGAGSGINASASVRFTGLC